MPVSYSYDTPWSESSPPHMFQIVYMPHILPEVLDSAIKYHLETCQECQDWADAMDEHDPKSWIFSGPA